MVQQFKGEDSLAPIAIESPGIDEAAAQFHPGRGHLFWRLGGLMGLSLAALLMATSALDAAQERDKARVSLSMIRRDAFEAFFSCALPDTLPERVVNRESLIASFERNANREGQRYGARLVSCVEPLTDLRRSLRTMEVPESAAAAHHSMSRGAEKLLTNFRAYAAHLNSPLQDDYVRSLALMDRVAGAYLEFEGARGDFLATLAR